MAAAPSAHAGPELAQQLRRAERRKRLRALALTLPLLAFLLVVFLLPLGSLLVRAVENPEVADTLAHTGQALSGWDRQGAPPDAAYQGLVQDLSALQETAQVGALARRLNSEISGARSLVMGTYRALPVPAGLDAAQTRDWLLAHDARWGELPYWQAIAKNASRWTPDYLLAAVDLQRTPQGAIEQVGAEAAAFRDILGRTFQMSATVTLLAILIGYPLAYWLSELPRRAANLCMIAVLLPLWTSLLVRTAAWFILLQDRGLINDLLMTLGLTHSPIPLIFNRSGVVVAMTHVLLPFMVLPIYSVLQAIPRNLMPAASSLGAPPWRAFLKVLLPLSLRGILSGMLLVFMTAIGYYITPALIGGAGDQMISSIIAYYAMGAANWGMAGALGMVLLVACLILYGVYARLTTEKTGSA